MLYCPDFLVLLKLKERDLVRDMLLCLFRDVFLDQPSFSVGVEQERMGDGDGDGDGNGNGMR